MLILYMSGDPLVWAVPLLIQIICYMKILGKMGKKPLYGIIPPLAELKMTEDLFRYTRTFWRPAVTTAVMMITAQYIGMDNQYGVILKVISLTVYGVFLIRLYLRLAKQFGKSWIFGICMVLFPLLFLLILAFGKSIYLGKREFPPERPRGLIGGILHKAGLAAITLAEFSVLIVGCFAVTILARPVRPFTEYLLKESIAEMKSVTDSDEIISRTDTVGADYEAAADAQRSRDYFFPDHSSDKKVVVMEYIIGADLEDARGSASVNISQMIDATAKGDGVDFVVQAGGSERWFTNGIKDSTVGRYLISGGSLTTSMMLDSELCMSEPENLTDFIVWTKENYPADRYMLVLWDHGGGFASGYGSDSLNKREDGKSLISASEIISAIRAAGVKFDVLGFDACLMQNIEYANAFEPFADYYLASEETEPSYGWFYTAGFGKLAEDPTMSTEEFGRSMVSSYDQLYRTINNGKPQPSNTLSLVDLTLVKPVYKKMAGLYTDSAAVIGDHPAIFANLSAARSGAYEFYDGEQVDLVSLLTSLKKADYKQQVASDDDLDKLIKAVNTCVVYRNSDSAEGVNGLATDFPYKGLGTYSSEYEQLRAANYKAEERFFNKFCSIMVGQVIRQTKQNEATSSYSSLLSQYYSNQKWYIKGFEDYDTADLFVDIPVKETADGYLPDLPDKTWDTILDSTTAAYMVTDDGLMYLGREHFAAEDAEGHPLTVMDDRWASIGGHMVCYEAETPQKTDDGIVYQGTVRARLNGKENITLYIEWDPVQYEDDEAKASSDAGSEDDAKAGSETSSTADADAGSEADSGESVTGQAAAYAGALVDDSAAGIGKDLGQEQKGRVTGYSRDDDDRPFFMRKGLEQLESGDSLEFLFDYYDEEGNLTDTRVYGSKLLIVTQDMLNVTDKPFEDGTVLEYYGVLTDVYQRELITEAIREQVVSQAN